MEIYIDLGVEGQVFAGSSNSFAISVVIISLLWWKNQIFSYNKS